MDCQWNVLNRNSDDEPAAASTALAVALPTATSTSSTLTNSTNGYMNGTSIDAGDDEGYDCDGGGDDGSVVRRTV